MKVIAVSVVLLAYLGLGSTGTCPPGYPYAFEDGAKCCAFGRERVDPNHFSQCDGSPITSTSNCCEHHAEQECPDPPCSNFYPCAIKSIRVLEQLREPSNMGSEVVGIVSGGSCTGSGEADLSITHAKSIEERVEISLMDRADVDWSKSSKFSLTGMPAFWSFGALIGGSWSKTNGGKRSVSETRSKSTAKEITSSSSNTSPYKIPGAGLLVATATQYQIDRTNLPVEVEADCKGGYKGPKDCVHEGKNLAWGDLRVVNDWGPPGNYEACVAACHADPECAAFTYVEYLGFFAINSRCYLKKPGYHRPSGCPFLIFTKCHSAELGRCGDPVEDEELPIAQTTYNSTIDIKELAYSHVHFTPMNTGKKRASKKCSSNLVTCVKEIPQTFRGFFGKVDAIEDAFKDCTA